MIHTSAFQPLLGTPQTPQRMSPQIVKNPSPQTKASGFGDVFHSASAKASKGSSGLRHNPDSIEGQNILTLRKIRQNPLYMGHVAPDQDELAKKFLAGLLAEWVQDMAKEMFENAFDDEEAEGSLGTPLLQEEAAKVWGRLLAEGEQFQNLVPSLRARA